MIKSKKMGENKAVILTKFIYIRMNTYRVFIRHDAPLQIWEKNLSRNHLKSEFLIEEMYWFIYSYVVTMKQYITIKSMRIYNHWNLKTQEKHKTEVSYCQNRTRHSYKRPTPALKLYGPAFGA